MMECERLRNWPMLAMDIAVGPHGGNMGECVAGGECERRVARAKSHASFVAARRRACEVVEAATGQVMRVGYDELRSPPLPLPPALPPASMAITSAPSAATRWTWRWVWPWAQPSWPVLKAALTYLIASLFVYVPPLAELLGSTDSKHIVCTVVVYFHSARTAGSMVQSLMFVAVALAFGISVSVVTMAGAGAVLGTHAPASRALAILGVLFICSCALGAISFCKHRVSKPTFNTACSLCAILTISCLVKEFSKACALPDVHSIPWDKISSSISCIIVGCIVSVGMCFILWRQSAESNLMGGIGNVQKLCGDTLYFLSDSFIGSWDETYEDREGELARIARARDEAGALFSNLQAKLDLLGTALEETCFECLPLGRETHYSILSKIVQCERRMAVNLGAIHRAVEFKWDILTRFYAEQDPPAYDLTTHDFMSVIDDVSTFDSDSSAGQDPVAEHPHELFDLFFYHLGPSTRSFVRTANEILQDPILNEFPTVRGIVAQYAQSLQTAKSLYQKHQLKAIQCLYQQDVFVLEPSFDSKVSHEEVAATCANFSYSLTQFALELECLLELINQLGTQDATSFRFLKLWERILSPVSVSGRNRANVLNHQTSSRLWELTKFFRGVDFQFGLRVALGALLLESLAFFPFTSHIFSEWRGEWALVTFCIIMNKSLGGTVMTVKWRFLGTFLGAFLAYWVWVLFYPNVILMALSGFLVSIPCFGIILYWKANNAFGRFILLTYNLTVLYSYTMSLNAGLGIGDDWEGGDNPIIFEIAFHRYLSVSVGVVWAVIITLTLFPMSARARVKQGLTTVWLRLGLIWKSGPLTSSLGSDGPRLVGLNGLQGCHKIHSELVTLHKQAPMEIRLKGEYQTAAYQTLITCTGNVIDCFENMNAIIDVDPMLSTTELAILGDLRNEIKELENRVFLMFYMLSSALTLKLPLMARAAGTEHAMEKVVAKLSDARRHAQQSADKEFTLSNEEFVLFFTYCLVTEAVVKELNVMMVAAVGLFDKLDEDLVELL